MELLQAQSLHTIVLIGALAACVLLFIAFFLIPAVVQGVKLSVYAKRLRRSDSKDLQGLSALFKRDRVLSHLWEEFRETLHPQTDLDAQGVAHVTAIRQTVPAEAYFSEQMLVHAPLSTEFFKHLPGILTGIGIIGTFTGLILGLQAFRVSESPDVVRESLNGLLQGVYHAFMFSAAAITLAMVITFIEKSVLTYLYSKVEALRYVIDSHFTAGVGEEYLSRLVQASESSAKEAKQLKQSLVNDLKQILESVAERQIQAQAATTAGLSKDIVAGLEASLGAPLATISSAVQHVSGSQSEAVNRLLTDTMAAMTAQIRDLFAGQVDGIRGMQQQTIDSLAVAVERLERLVGDIANRGRETTDAMGAELASVLAAMEERQRAASEQSQALVEAMRNHISKSQDEAAAVLQASVDRMRAAVETMVEGLQANVRTAAERDADRNRQLAEHTTAATTGVSTLTKELIRHTAEAVTTMKQAVDTLRTGGTEMINRMNAGAADMLKAASEMARAGGATATTLETAKRVADQLASASSSLVGSTTTLTRAIEDYKANRESLGAMVEQLRATVDNARKEATLTADILRRIESATQALSHAQRQAEEYLAGVSDVLAGAHQQFGTQVISTLNNVNGEFYKHVERGTKALAGAIDELNQVLDTVGAR